MTFQNFFIKTIIHHHVLERKDSTQKLYKFYFWKITLKSVFQSQSYGKYFRKLFYIQMYSTELVQISAKLLVYWVNKFLWWKQEKNKHIVEMISTILSCKTKYEPMTNFTSCCCIQKHVTEIGRTIQHFGNIICDLQKIQGIVEYVIHFQIWL